MLSATTHYQTLSNGMPFSYTYAYPYWLKENHHRILKAIAHFGLIDSVQLMRLTGWPKVKLFRLTKVLEEKNFIKSFGRGEWAQTDGTRRAHIWGLLPRGAWRLSLDTHTPFNRYKTYQNASPAASNAEHSIDLTDIRLSFELHAADAGIEVTSWKTEAEWRVGEALHIPSLGRGKGIEIRPDGSAVLRDRKGHKSYVFIEADRTNRNNWPEKIRAYKDLWSSGEFHRQFKISDVSTGFRVLVTTKSQHRANYLKKQTETVGRGDLAGLFLFAPIAAVATTSNVYTASIWGRGGHEAGQSLYGSTANAGEVVLYEATESSVLNTDGKPQSYLPNPQFQLGFDSLA